MPIYEYICTNCKEESEKMVPISVSDLQECANCNIRLKRKMSVPGYVWSPSKERK